MNILSQLANFNRRPAMPVNRTALRGNPPYTLADNTKNGVPKSI
jgi:hypothetical protein